MNFWCEIYKDKILQNIKKIKTLSNKKIMAVVKGNAYGLGVDQIVDIIEDEIDYYAVSSLKEAKEIKTKKEILILSPISEIESDSQDNFIYTIDNESQLSKIDKDKKYKIHIYINTGMNRLGIEPKNLDNLIDDIYKKYNNIVIDGIYTHLSNASDLEYTKKQVMLFKSTVEKYISIIPNIHCLNSKGFLSKEIRDITSFTTIVRAGNLLYGYDGLSFGFEKVFKVKAKVIKSYITQNDGYIGYSGKFTVKKDTLVGVLPCGTVDKIGYSKDIKESFLKGLLKYIRNNFKQKRIFYYKGKPLKLLCTPNMNCSLVDVSNIPEEDIVVDVNISSILLDSSVKKIII